MIAEGRTNYTELPELFFKSKPIDNEWVIKGAAYIAPLVKRNGIFSVYIMFLSPSSHVVIPRGGECSLYKVFQADDKDKREYCLNKECELVNSSESDWLLIHVSRRY